MVAELKAQSSQKTRLCGTFLNRPTDTLYLSFYREKLGLSEAGSDHFTTISKNGKFCFALPEIDHPAYITLTSGNSPRLYLLDYLVEAGDSVHITIDPSQAEAGQSIARSGLSFSGKGAEKFRANYIVEQLAAKKNFELPMYTIRLQANLDTLLLGSKDHIQPLGDYKLHVLDSLKEGISTGVYEILRCNIFYNTEVVKIRSIINQWYGGFKFPDSLARRKFMTDYALKEWENPMVFGSYLGRRYSKEYLDFLIFRSLLITKCKLAIENTGPITRIIPEIEKTKGVIGERAFTGMVAYITGLLKNVVDSQSFIDYANSRVTEPMLKTILNSCITVNQKGVPIFPFELTGMKGEKIKASELKGSAVLLDFWFSGCMPCIEVAKALKKVKAQVGRMNNIQFLSISADTNRDLWLASVRSEKYSELDDINSYTGGLGLQHPLWQYYQVNACPRLMLIDAKGNLVSANLFRPVTPEKAQELIKLLLEAAKQ